MSNVFWRWRTVVCLGLAAAAAPMGRATIYNAVTDFSVGSNPNGVWTYLVSGTPYPLSDGHVNTCSFTGCLMWYNGNPLGTAAFIVDNVSGSTHQYLTIPYATNYLS